MFLEALFKEDAEQERTAWIAEQFYPKFNQSVQYDTRDYTYDPRCYVTKKRSCVSKKELGRMVGRPPELSLVAGTPNSRDVKCRSLPVARGPEGPKAAGRDFASSGSWHLERTAELCWFLAAIDEKDVSPQGAPSLFALIKTLRRHLAARCRPDVPIGRPWRPVRSRCPSSLFYFEVKETPGMA